MCMCYMYTYIYTHIDIITTHTYIVYIDIASYV